jgi:hypothetical protein
MEGQSGNCDNPHFFSAVKFRFRPAFPSPSSSLVGCLDLSTDLLSNLDKDAAEHCK